ncbi:TRAP transporter small permease [Oscillibacter sp.]|uniref:TRAP transporter small permease n=1 Tax=Oscillibacter sp. TaxID=1945593 RepID=UPI00260DD955|nr:TRAP transporter small permease subunit [Oscillibacter sp.]MDD3347202.1 TRAP transporter small permease subunit [Oscillibacter sp.]
MKHFKKICSAFESGINVMIVVVAVTMMIIGVLQILFRYVFSASLSWSEESIRYLHVWLVTIGGTVCFYRETFSVITLISDKIEAKSKLAGKFLAALRFVFPIIFYGIMLLEGWKVCAAYVVKKAAATQISMAIVYACIPLSGIIGILFSIAKLPDFIAHLTGRNAK